MLKMPDGTSTVIIQGKRRFELKEVTQEDPFLRGQIELCEEEKAPKDNKEFTAIIQSMKELSVKIIKESPNIPSEAQFAIKNIDSPTFLINFISSNMNAHVATRSEEHTSELQSRPHLVCRLLLEKKKKIKYYII